MPCRPRVPTLVALTGRPPRPDRRIVNLSLAAAATAVALVAIELVLRTWYPAPLITIGRTLPDNARLYGWGYDPRERIIVRDPDSGRVHVDFANNHGWRDRDRSFENPDGAFRILVLGDSNTFGAIVPAAAVYTRVLEDRLRAEGYRVDVINMSYGGWSTDQQLEALRREGLRYDPDLVVLQFTTNDPGENIFSPDPRGRKTAKKPFYYKISGDGKLTRHESSSFDTNKSFPLKDTVKKYASRFETLKRLYLVYADWRGNSSGGRNGGYRVSRKQWRQLQMAFGVAADDPLGRFLHDRLDQSLDRTEIERAITASGRDTSMEGILRLCEDRWFSEYWSDERYRPEPQQPDTEAWRLFLALLSEINRETRRAGADLIVLSDHEEGLYEWERYWFRIAPEEQARRNFLAINGLLRGFSADNGIGFVEPRVIHTRARNDPHPNIQGNLAMAENLYRHLMSHRKAVLDSHRLASRNK